MCIYRMIMVVLMGMFVSGCVSTPDDRVLPSDHAIFSANLYKKQAAQGDGLAAVNLGLLVLEGRVSADKYSNYTDWFERACNLGNNTGCHNAAHSYVYGKDNRTIDFAKAQSLYLKAADRGYVQSQYNLGSLYANKRLKNDVEGYKWLLLSIMSAKQCVSEQLCQWILSDPPGHFANIESRMSPDQIEQATLLARRWKSKAQ